MNSSDHSDSRDGRDATATQPALPAPKETLLLEEHPHHEEDHDEGGAPDKGRRRKQSADAEKPGNKPPSNEPPKKDAHRSRGRFLILLLVLALALAVLFAFGLFARMHRGREQKETARTQEAAARTVQVVRPSKAPPIFDFGLPGSAEPLQQATLYARTNGYLKERLVDIGDRVTEGQLLARIEAPDVDAQLRQAQASLEQLRAAFQLARVNFDRQKKLLTEKVVSRQEYDQNEAAFNQANANQQAGEANVANLQAQKSFQEIRAPFDGVVTARFTDVGSLIAPGTSQSAPSLFTVAQTDILRVFVNVPQAYAVNIQAGQDVDITAAEYPKETFRGKVARSARALDPAARTERVEVQLSSENGRLLPGMYLGVNIKVQSADSVLIAPASTLVIRREGPRVATVTADKKIQYKLIELGRDFGTNVEVLKGLDGKESLVINPTDDLTDGEAVEPQEKKDDKKPEGARPPSDKEQKDDGKKEK